MKHLARLTPFLWVCISDFNEIVVQSGKYGGRGRPSSQMIAFQQTLEFCDLSDLGFHGPKFNWTNCRDGSDFTKVRLDRGVANAAWWELYPLAEIVVEVVPCSDQTLLLLCLTEEQRGRQGGARFRYEERWTLDAGYHEVM